MSEARWQYLEELFARTLALGPPERAAFFEQHCPEDADLRAECARLLALDDEAERDRFLDPTRTSAYRTPTIEPRGPEASAQSAFPVLPAGP